MEKLAPYMSSDSSLEKYEKEEPNEFKDINSSDSDQVSNEPKKVKKTGHHLQKRKENSKKPKKKRNQKKNINDQEYEDEDYDEEEYDEEKQLFKEQEIQNIFKNTYLFEKDKNKSKKKKNRELFSGLNINPQNINKEKKDTDSKSNSNNSNNEEVDNEELKVIFSDKFKETKNTLSLNYYTKKIKMENLSLMSNITYDGSFRIKNSENYLMFNYDKEKLYVYNSTKKTIKVKKMHIGHIKSIHEGHFLVIDSFRKEIITILHYDNDKNDFIIDQTLDLPEEKDLNIHGPFAPYLSCYPLSEKYILFHWKTANNFYIYKNVSENSEKIEL